MGLLLDRTEGILRRVRSANGCAPAVRKILVDSNRATLLAGRNRDGSATAPLRAATLKRRKGTGPPRVPRGDGSRAISAFVVVIDVSAASITATGSWPGFEAARYLNTGTARMPARPMGWTADASKEVMQTIRNYVMGE